MTSSPVTRDQLRLFGLDLGALWQAYRAGWAEALQWPLFAWLNPADPVRLLQADGRESVWRAGRRLAGGWRAPRFVAVELPEDLVLRRVLTLPDLPLAEVQEAVALEARSASPFPPEDLASGYRVHRLAGGPLEVEIALASRRQIEGALRAAAPRLRGRSPEVWAGGAKPVVFEGYGAPLRLRQAARRRAGLLVLLGLAAALVAAIAVTPTAKLRLQALQANAAHEQLRAATAPQVRLRDQLVSARAQVQAIGQVLAARPDALPVLALVTRLLPDNTFLLRLELRGQTVRLTGQTDNAANLMQILGDHPGLRDVRAPTAATRPAGATKENFTIEFTLDPKVPAP